MKTGKEVLDGTRTLTIITCTVCGNQTSVKGRSTNVKAQAALSRKCRPCNPVIRQCGSSWWSQFGLTKNPYVYGPMPRLRTSEQYRIQEARQRGWLAWYWVDEYTDERKRVMK
jgi:hypothetical protein